MTYRTALIPIRRSPHGPVTTSRRRRIALAYAVSFVTGTTIAVLAKEPSTVALGLGLVAPGGGFLVHAAGNSMHVVMHVGMAAATLAAFGVGLVAWFGSGNVVVPVVVWLGALLWAAAMDHGHAWPAAAIVVPGSVLAAAAGLVAVGRLRFRRDVALGSERNRYLERTGAVETPAGPAGLPEVDELSREDVSAMRFLLDRALQPVGEFNGYSWIEQFQTSAMRYQLMMTSYALALAQATRCPSFRGYLSTAQVNLIEKTKLSPVWSYWKWENAVGNLRLGEDPMAPDTHDNVMYSGWLAAMIGMYQSNTGDDRYDAPGSITLRSSRGREYVYDWPVVVGMLADNFSRSAFTLFPCEPNWIYPLCNTYAGIGLRIHDRLRGTDYWARLEPSFRKGLEDEFTGADGRIAVIRSSLTGFAVPLLSSIMTDAGLSVFQHALLPDVARRSWEILRHDLIEMSRGRLHLRYHGSDFLDVGNYSFSRAGVLACISGLATEMGDTEVATAARELFAAKYRSIVEHGTTRYPGLSVNTHLLAFAGRVNRTNGIHDLVARGIPESFRTGPVLEEAAYPDVLVAKAVSDGQAFSAVLYPGREQGRRELGLGQLVPGRRYRCEGAVERELCADERGRGRLHVELSGRTELRAAPVV